MIFHAYDFYAACDAGEASTESFYNEAVAEPLNGTPPDYEIQDTENLYATCNYALTRNTGDVLFYTDTDPGANLGALTEDETRNSDGLVFINKALSFVDKIFGGGPGGSLSASKCDNWSSNNLIPHILSSFICEVYYDPFNTFDAWKPSQINQTTEFDFLEGVMIDPTSYQFLQSLSNIDTATYEVGYNYSALDAQGNRGKTYKFDGDVHIGQAGDAPIVLEGGARTFIIEGDLSILTDITYPDDTGLSDHEISSIAFIVTGDVNIHPDVQVLSGVYISKGGSFNSMSQIGPYDTAITSSDKQLVIYGSVFGNLQPLINDRMFIGAPILDGGNIVIRYDNRALRNTPPGLKDAIDLKWLRVAR